MGITQIPVSRQVGKQTVVYPYNEILLLGNKEKLLIHGWI